MTASNEIIGLVRTVGSCWGGVVRAQRMTQMFDTSVSVKWNEIAALGPATRVG